MQKLWTQLTLSQRITIGAAAGGVIVGMLALVFWAHRPQMQLLYGRLGEKDIAEVSAALQEQGVKFEARGSSVYVSGDQVHKVRMTLASKGIPAGDGVGFEIFDRSNFGISDFVQRTNYSRALQGELSRTIAQLNGVRSARVMIVMPENRLLFSEQKAKPTASIFIEQSGGALGSEAVNSIRFLVANSVEGLRVDDVTVVDSRGNLLSEPVKDESAIGAATTQMKYRKSVEDYFSGKVETMLAKVVGSGNAVVRVSAEIDTDSATTTSEKFDPDGQVVRNETNTEDTTTTTEADGDNAANQPVGLSSNTPQNNAANAANKAGKKSSEQSRKSKTNTYEINRVTVNSTKSPGGITRVSAAVFVAAKAQPRKPEEIENLRKMVVNALGVRADAAQEMDKTVTLQEVAFEGQPAEKTNFTDVIYSNSDLVRNGFAALVAIVLLGVFFRMLKRAKPDAISFELLDPEGAMANGQTAARPHEHTRGEVSADLLNELIRAKPENVGAALRGWMANGSTAAAAKNN